VNIVAKRSGTLLYTRVVADARRALSTAEIGGIARVTERSVQNWATGKSTPEGGARDRLLELKFVVEELSDVFEDEGIEIWLRSRQRALDGETPLDLMRKGEFQKVLDAVERLAGGPERR
jgi:hypothetical protein